METIETVKGQSREGALCPVNCGKPRIKRPCLKGHDSSLGRRARQAEVCSIPVNHANFVHCREAIVELKMLGTIYGPTPPDLLQEREMMGVAFLHPENRKRSKASHLTAQTALPPFSPFIVKFRNFSNISSF
ncbi:hypothetical protein L596_000553 [Steinernema carpocapsae]|uniref:Uncharacterized protein n=1 Tax=Steinernema carpocapsae TaxID=34508 RepID=A0A4U8UIF2_STECR|nr:hypothetical protein L596_000553 [Steinernema carpocapsae]